MGQFPKCIPLKQISGFYCVEIPSRIEKCKSTLEKLGYMMKETFKTSKTRHLHACPHKGVGAFYDSPLQVKMD